MVEAGAYPIEVNSELESKCHHLFENDDLDLPFTAHPHIDPDTGDIHAVCYDGLTHNKVFYLHIHAQGKLKIMLRFQSNMVRWYMTVRLPNLRS